MTQIPTKQALPDWMTDPIDPVVPVEDKQALPAWMTDPIDSSESVTPQAQAQAQAQEPPKVVIPEVEESELESIRPDEEPNLKEMIDDNPFEVASAIVDEFPHLKNPRFTGLGFDPEVDVRPPLFMRMGRRLGSSFIQLPFKSRDEKFQGRAALRQRASQFGDSILYAEGNLFNLRTPEELQDASRGVLLEQAVFQNTNITPLLPTERLASAIDNIQNDLKNPPPLTVGEYIADAAGSLGAFIARLMILRRVLPGGGRGATKFTNFIREPVIWGIESSVGGGTFAHGAGMGLMLQAIGALPGARPIFKVLLESAAFGAVGAVEGADEVDLYIMMAIPWALRAPRTLQALGYKSMAEAKGSLANRLRKARSEKDLSEALDAISTFDKLVREEHAFPDEFVPTNDEINIGVENYAKMLKVSDPTQKANLMRQFRQALYQEGEVGKANKLAREAAEGLDDMALYRLTQKSKSPGAKDVMVGNVRVGQQTFEAVLHRRNIDKARKHVEDEAKAAEPTKESKAAFKKGEFIGTGKIPETDFIVGDEIKIANGPKVWKVIGGRRDSDGITRMLIVRSVPDAAAEGGRRLQRFWARADRLNIIKGVNDPVPIFELPEPIAAPLVQAPIPNTPSRILYNLGDPKAYIVPLKGKEGTVTKQGAVYALRRPDGKVVSVDQKMVQDLIDSGDIVKLGDDVWGRPDESMPIKRQSLAELDFQERLDEALKAFPERQGIKENRRGGDCFACAEQIQKNFGFPAVEGVWTPGGDIAKGLRTGEIYTHMWNMLPDGRILDVAAGQFYDVGPVTRIWEPTDARDYVPLDQVPKNLRDQVDLIVQSADSAQRPSSLDKVNADIEKNVELHETVIERMEELVKEGQGERVERQETASVPVEQLEGREWFHASDRPLDEVIVRAEETGQPIFLSTSEGFSKTHGSVTTRAAISGIPKDRVLVVSKEEWQTNYAPGSRSQAAGRTGVIGKVLQGLVTDFDTRIQSIKDEGKYDAVVTRFETPSGALDVAIVVNPKAVFTSPPPSIEGLRSRLTPTLQPGADPAIEAARQLPEFQQLLTEASRLAAEFRRLKVIRDQTQLNIVSETSKVEASVRADAEAVIDARDAMERAQDTNSAVQGAGFSKARRRKARKDFDKALKKWKALEDKFIEDHGDVGFEGISEAREARYLTAAKLSAGVTTPQPDLKVVAESGEAIPEHSPYIGTHQSSNLRSLKKASLEQRNLAFSVARNSGEVLSAPTVAETKGQKGIAVIAVWGKGLDYLNPKHQKLIDDINESAPDTKEGRGGLGIDAWTVEKLRERGYSWIDSWNGISEGQELHVINLSDARVMSTRPFDVLNKFGKPKLSKEKLKSQLTSLNVEAKSIDARLNTLSEIVGGREETTIMSGREQAEILGPHQKGTLQTFEQARRLLENVKAELGESVQIRRDFLGLKPPQEPLPLNQTEQTIERIEDAIAVTENKISRIDSVQAIRKPGSDPDFMSIYQERSLLGGESTNLKTFTKVREMLDARLSSLRETLEYHKVSARKIGEPKPKPKPKADTSEVKAVEEDIALDDAAEITGQVVIEGTGTRDFEVPSGLPEGSPTKITAFHGTMRKGIPDKTPKGGFHSGSRLAATQRLEDATSAGVEGKAKIVKVEVTLAKPLGSETNPLSDRETRQLLNNPKELRRLKRKGFDGIVYRNDSEDAGSISVVAFDMKSVKRVKEPRPKRKPKPSKTARPSLSVESFTTPRTLVVSGPVVVGRIGQRSEPIVEGDVTTETQKPRKVRLNTGATKPKSISREEFLENYKQGVYILAKKTLKNALGLTGDAIYEELVAEGRVVEPAKAGAKTIQASSLILRNRVTGKTTKGELPAREAPVESIEPEAAVGETPESNERMRLMQEAMRDMTPEHVEILTRRFGLETGEVQTLPEAAKKMGISVNEALALERSAYTDLVIRLGEEAPGTSVEQVFDRHDPGLRRGLVYPGVYLELMALPFKFINRVARFQSYGMFLLMKGTAGEAGETVYLRGMATIDKIAALKGGYAKAERRAGRDLNKLAFGKKGVGAAVTIQQRPFAVTKLDFDPVTGFVRDHVLRPAGVVGRRTPEKIIRTTNGLPVAGASWVVDPILDIVQGDIRPETSGQHAVSHILRRVMRITGKDMQDAKIQNRKTNPDKSIEVRDFIATPGGRVFPAFATREFFVILQRGPSDPLWNVSVDAFADVSGKPRSKVNKFFQDQREHLTTGDPESGFRHVGAEFTREYRRRPTAIRAKDGARIQLFHTNPRIIIDLTFETTAMRIGFTEMLGQDGAMIKKMKAPYVRNGGNPYVFDDAFRALSDIPPKFIGRGHRIPESPASPGYEGTRILVAGQEVYKQFLLTATAIIQIPETIIFGIRFGMKRLIRGMANGAIHYKETQEKMMEIRATTKPVMNFILNREHAIADLLNKAAGFLSRLHGNRLSNEIINEQLAGLQGMQSAVEIMERGQAGVAPRAFDYYNLHRILGFDAETTKAILKGEGTQENHNALIRRMAEWSTGSIALMAEKSIARNSSIYRILVPFQGYFNNRTRMISMDLRGSVETAQEFGKAWSKHKADPTKANLEAMRNARSQGLAGLNAVSRNLGGTLITGLLGQYLWAMLRENPSEAFDQMVRDFKYDKLGFFTDLFVWSTFGPIWGALHDVTWKGISPEESTDSFIRKTAKFIMPIAIMMDLRDMGLGLGPYKNRTAADRVGKFLALHTPVLHTIPGHFVLNLLGVEMEDLPTQNAVKEAWSWIYDPKNGVVPRGGGSPGSRDVDDRRLGILLRKGVQKVLDNQLIDHWEGVEEAVRQSQRTIKAITRLKKGEVQGFEEITIPRTLNPAGYFRSKIIFNHVTLTDESRSRLKARLGPTKTALIEQRDFLMVRAMLKANDMYQINEERAAIANFLENYEQRIKHPLLFPDPLGAITK